MKSILSVIALMVPSAVYAGPYVTLGIALHNTRLDCPEVCGLGEPLGKAEVGYRYRVSETVEMAAFFEHVSGLSVFERGYGLNMVGAEVTFHWE